MGTIGSVVRAVIGGMFVAGLVACSGGISTVGSDGGTSSSGGSSGTSSGSSGSSSGGGECNVEDMGVTRACVPGTATAGVALSIQAEGENNCLGCGTTLEPCNVQVSGSKIIIGLAVNRCTLPPDTACPAVCMFASATCTIPPLAAGTYNVDFASGIRSSGDIPRQLVVKEGTGVTSCTIPNGAPSPTIESDDFPDTCSIDDDCALVTEGDICQACACPNEAIAKTALENYQSNVRALQSLCKNGGGAGSCAPCQERKARCSGGKCISVTP